MIRTGYLRWEIDVRDERSRDDRRAREVIFAARPSYRVVRFKMTGDIEAAQRFVRGEAAYDAVLRTLQREGGEIDVRIPDVGPYPFRYDESDRTKMPRYWMEKLQREAIAFAHEVVRAASSFPQLVIASPALRAGYARLVAAELGLSEGRWSFCYQSAGAAPGEWLGPSIEQILPDYARKGLRNILAIPVGFMADHVEVLYDLDIEAQEIARAAGIHLERSESLNA